MLHLGAKLYVRELLCDVARPALMQEPSEGGQSSLVGHSYYRFILFVERLISLIIFKIDYDFKLNFKFRFYFVEKKIKDV